MKRAAQLSCYLAAALALSVGFWIVLQGEMIGGIVMAAGAFSLFASLKT